MAKKSIFTQERELLLLAGLIFIVFFALGYARPYHIFWSLDEGGKWIYMQSVLQTGDPRTPLIYPGRALDSSLENIALFFFSRQGDQIYSWWAYGFPLLTLPLYKILGWAGLFLLPALAGAANAYFAGKIAGITGGGSRGLGIAVCLVTALATPITFYSATFWEHTLSTACVMGMAYCFLISQEIASWKPLVIGGIAGSLAIFFRTEAALLIIGMGGIFLLRFPRKAVWVALGGLVTSLVWMAANQYWMGNILSANVNQVQGSSLFSAFLNAGKKLIPYILFNAPIISAFDLGKNLLIVGTLSAGLSFGFGLFPKTRWLSAAFLIPVSAVCFYVLVQPGSYRSVHGLVLISPFIVIASWVFSSVSWGKYTWFWLTLTGGLFVFTVGYLLRAWVAAGGQQWGPRYMLAFYPILTAAVGVGCRELLAKKTGLPRLFYSASVAFAVLVGLGYEIRGYVSMVTLMSFYQASSAPLQAMQDEVILTDCTWLPMVIPDVYWKGNLFLNPPKETLLANLKKAGYVSYQYVDMQSCHGDFVDAVGEMYKDNPGGLVVESIKVDP